MTPGIFLTAEWRALAMLNFPIAPAALRPHVPAGTELDYWDDRTFVSVVGFLFLRTSVLGWSIPLHQDFEEVNLRFYVRRRTAEGWRRGVVFVKEIVPRPMVAAVARLVYHERYVALPMRHEIDLPAGPGPGRVEYGWRYRGRWNALRVRTRGRAQPLSPASEAEFITEHYWGYAARRDGRSVEYQVEHPRWLVWTVDDAALDCDVAALYGEPFVEALRAPVSSAFVAEGSPIVVRRGVMTPLP